MKIRLETLGGGFVGEWEVMPFVLPPKVMSWGSRTFVLDEAKSPKDALLYIEDLNWVLLDGFTAKKLS